MITDTLFIFGPGGTGKRSLNYLLKDYVVRIHPHVLRNSGPRGTNDIRYANPGLYDDIYSLFRIFGTVGRHLPADDLDHIDELKDLTRGNCSSRGDSEESINEVLASVDEEIESWRHMIDEFGAGDR